MSIPFELRQFLEILVIDQGDLPLREWNFLHSKPPGERRPRPELAPWFGRTDSLTEARPYGEKEHGGQSKGCNAWLAVRVRIGRRPRVEVVGKLEEEISPGLR
jgi:hypothetical protein